VVSQPIIIQQLINGVSQGSIYALFAISFSLVWGLLKLVNFALGEIYMVGAFTGWIIFTYVTHNILLAIPFALFFGWLWGYIIEKIAFKAMRGAPHIASLICTIGFSFFLKELAAIVFGVETKSVPAFYEGTAFIIMGANLSWLNLFMIASAVIIVILLQYFFFRTKMGLAVRAQSTDIDTAGLMGINVDKVNSAAFSLSGAIAGFVGLLAAVYYNAIYPTMGLMPGLKGFTAAVFGGLTSIPGAILGGYLLGIIEALGVQLISSGFKDLIAFTILIAFLLFRPQGILGKRENL